MGDNQALLHDAHRFGPAAPDEKNVYGSCAPGWHSAADHETCLEEWIEDMQSAGIERVCCLLATGGKEASQGHLGLYREAFGAENVLHAPISTNRLADRELLVTEILPFLEAATLNEERVVVHCLAGLGRTGQVLAAWLAYDRGYGPERAVETVQSAGRDPTDAIRQGNATKEELYELLESVRGESR